MATDIISLNNIQDSEFLTMFEQSRSLLPTSLSETDRKVIIFELGKMAMLRGERVGDYAFELWVERFAESGYSHREIIEIIELGKDLKKYGAQLLAYGDLISEYEKQRKEEEGEDYRLSINWRQFFRVLRLYEQIEERQMLSTGKNRAELRESHIARIEENNQT